MDRPLSDTGRTIDDFDAQWSRYTANEGYYASQELFWDIFAPVLPRDAVADARVLDLGAGTGRITQMLLAAGAREVLAVEPAAGARRSLRANLQDDPRVQIVPCAGAEIPPSGDVDLVVSAGVLHHIPNPGPTVRAIHAALRPGGRCAVWLYGREGNELYLRAVGPLRRLTPKLPPWALAGVAWGLWGPAEVYGWAARRFHLPLADYYRRVWKPLDRAARRLVIYDQLNPTYAKYYTEPEARALLDDGGFRNVCTHHRHGSSWTVGGIK